MVVKSEQKIRIKQELIAAGMTSYGLSKAEARHLPAVLHQTEHVGGVIYGRYKKSSLMIVATNKRLLIMDHKFLYSRNDELAYDVLSGVSYNDQGRFVGIVVHTRLGDYPLRFVNHACAEKFVRFVEKKRIEKPGVFDPQNIASNARANVARAIINQGTRAFLTSHNIATFSTSDQNGKVSAAVVYYALSPDNTFYLVTKSQTKKAQNIQKNNQVALTVYDTNQLKTAQIQGLAIVESNANKTHDLIDRFIQPHIYDRGIAWPPITKIVGGNHQVIKITPTEVKFTDYKA